MGRQRKNRKWIFSFVQASPIFSSRRPFQNFSRGPLASCWVLWPNALHSTTSDFSSAPPPQMINGRHLILRYCQFWVPYWSEKGFDITVAMGNPSQYNLFKYTICIFYINSWHRKQDLVILPSSLLVFHQPHILLIVEWNNRNYSA